MLSIFLLVLFIDSFYEVLTGCEPSVLNHSACVLGDCSSTLGDGVSIHLIGNHNKRKFKIATADG